MKDIVFTKNSANVLHWDLTDNTFIVLDTAKVPRKLRDNLWASCYYNSNPRSHIAHNLRVVSNWLVIQSHKPKALIDKLLDDIANKNASPQQLTKIELYEDWEIILVDHNLLEEEH